MEYEAEQTLFREFANQGWQMVDAAVLRYWKKESGKQGFHILPRDTGEIQFDVVKSLENTLKKIPRHIVDILQIDGDSLPTVDVGAKSELNMADSDRVNSVFWGLATHNKKMFCQAAREIIVKDFLLGPEVNALWDLDRLLVGPKDNAGNSRIIYLEIKHKYPMASGVFGLNKGEVRTIEMLRQAGVECWYIILVKPVWRETLSPMYLYFDRNAREHAAWIAGDMKGQFVLVGGGGSAAAKTSIYRQSNVSFETIDPAVFSLVGMNSASVDDLSQNLYDLFVDNKALPNASPEFLKNCRL